MVHYIVGTLGGLCAECQVCSETLGAAICLCTVKVRACILPPVYAEHTCGFAMAVFPVL